MTLALNIRILEMSDWCLIESDPGVFTELIKGFGAKNVLVEELYGLSQQNFEHIKPIYGLIFLFKWRQADDSKANIVKDDRLGKLFFAKQVITNACATQAILSILLNAPQKKNDDDIDGVDLGETLQNFKEFSKDFDPVMKGLTLNNSDNIRLVHNTFARQQMFEFDSKSASKDEDVFHFISYVPFEGRLYELDGLREGPVDLGAIRENSDWIEAVRPVIEKRMQQYNEDEIQFNLMAVVADKMPHYQRRLAELEQQLTSGMVDDNIEIEMADLRMLILKQKAKLQAYKVENIHRKYNYLPTIMDILNKLASQSRLEPLYIQAKAKAKKGKQRELERKRKKESS